MSFPAELTSVLSGASVSQLHRWRRTRLLVPEVHEVRPALYSFRDVVALRTVVRLRAEVSLQKIRSAFGALPEFDLTDHPSEYQFATDGSSVAVWMDDGFMDLVKRPGQFELYSLSDIYKPFTTKAGADVVDFTRPRRHLRVDARKMGGWPTIEGTRVTYDVIAQALDGSDLDSDDIQRFYPGVSAEAAGDAVSFDSQVRSLKRAAA